MPGINILANLSQTGHATVARRGHSPGISLAPMLQELATTCKRFLNLALVAALNVGLVGETARQSHEPLFH
jgi:hypothetical protein